jgi:hypothetical protein
MRPDNTTILSERRNLLQYAEWINKFQVGGALDEGAQELDVTLTVDDENAVIRSRHQSRQVGEDVESLDAGIYGLNLICQLQRLSAGWSPCLYRPGWL